MLRRSERDHLDASPSGRVDDLEPRREWRDRAWLRSAASPVGVLWWIAGAVVVAKLLHRVPPRPMLGALAIATGVVAVVLLVRAFRSDGWDPFGYVFPPLVIAAMAGVGILGFLDHPPVAIVVALVLGRLRRDRPERRKPDAPDTAARARRV